MRYTLHYRDPATGTERTAYAPSLYALEAEFELSLDSWWLIEEREESGHYYWVDSHGNWGEGGWGHDSRAREILLDDREIEVEDSHGPRLATPILDDHDS